MPPSAMKQPVPSPHKGGVEHSRKAARSEQSSWKWLARWFLGCGGLIVFPSPRSYRRQDNLHDCSFPSGGPCSSILAVPLAAVYRERSGKSANHLPKSGRSVGRTVARRTGGDQAVRFALPTPGRKGTGAHRPRTLPTDPRAAGFGQNSRSRTAAP